MRNFVVSFYISINYVTFSKKFRKHGTNEAVLIPLNIFLFFLGIWYTYGIEIRQNKYLNNLIEQDYGNIKRLTRPMLGFKSWESIESTVFGYELVNNDQKKDSTLILIT